MMPFSSSLEVVVVEEVVMQAPLGPVVVVVVVVIPPLPDVSVFAVVVCEGGCVATDNLWI